LVRKRNASLISSATFAKSLLNLRSEILDPPTPKRIAATDALAFSSIHLIDSHSVNSTDAILLQSSLELAASLRAGGDDLVLVSSDRRLITAAKAEGLVTFNPESQTTAELDALIAP